MEIKHNSTSSRGGARPGAGRPPSEVTELRRSVAKDLLTPADERKRWLQFLNSKDPKVALQAFLALQDRAYGRPAQAVDVTTKGESIITQCIVNL
jgi:hypothetical protein